MKRKLIISLLMTCLLIMGTGCTKNDEDDNKEKDDPIHDVVDDNKQKDDAQANKDVDVSDKLKDGKVELTLYIGYETEDGKAYKKVDALSGEYNAQTFNLGEQLLAALEAETGWKLTLADPVHDLKGDGGRRLSFTEESCFVAGPPLPQKDEYMAYDIVSFTQLVLDSIQKTFDENYNNDGDEEMKLYVSIYDEPIEVEGRTIPVDVPWNEVQDHVLKSNE